MNIDSIFVEETEKEEKLSDDKHFENPLENEFTPDEFMDDDESIKETDIQNVETTESSDLIDEKLDVEITQSTDESQFVVAEDEKQDEINETQIPNMIPDDGIKDEKTLDQVVVLNEEYKETVFEDKSEAINNDLEKIELMEPVKEESITEEEMLFNLTEEIDKVNNEEIIILDDKEQEDLLNFYDNELEISIDDDNDKLKKDLESGNETEIDIETTELNLEHELEIKENQDEGIAIDKIDFEKDLAPAISEEKEEQSDTAYKSKLKSKSEDIFSYLSKKEIDKIIKNLFNSDSEDFANTVEKMSECSNYDEASRILDNVFKYARIKPHSKEAAMLKGAVAKFFNVDI